MDISVNEELIGVAHAWDRAMVTNDPEAIGAYMAALSCSACWHNFDRITDWL